MAPQLGWIGLGNMGRGMCKNLVEKGDLDKPLIIFNRTTSKAKSLSEKIGHSTVASSIPDLVSKSDIVFYCLGDDQSVLDTLDKILETSLKGKIVVDCSTVHPDTTTKENEKITKAGGQFVAMPVFGAQPMAESGNLICVFAGPASVTDKVKPYAKGVMGRANIDLSDQPPSKATTLKIIGNTFIISMVTTIAEGHTLAEKTGLGTEDLHQYLEVMFPGPYTAYSERMMSGDYHTREEPLFGVDLARKDARHAKQLANDSGAKMRIVDLADEYLAAVKAEQQEKGDITGIYGAKRQEAGLPYKNK